MPKQRHPPYASGALSIPRTLNRWLDINAQNGPLFRTSTFITLPSFLQSVSTWNGYSDIVYAYNFEGPNGFSLIGIKDLVPSEPNYTCCVSYQINGVVTRYLLWDATGSNMEKNIPLYVNQPIKKNFRIEIWNTSQGAVSQATSLNFYTSKKGQVDYRYGTDTSLVNNDGQVSDFVDTSDYTPLPTPTPATDDSIIDFFFGRTDYVITNYWKGYFNVLQLLTAYNNQVVAPDNTLADIESVTIPDTQNYSGIIPQTNTAYAVFMLVKFTELNVGNILCGFGGAYFGAADMAVTVQSGPVLSIDGNTLQGPFLSINTWYVVFLYYNVDGQATAGYVTPLSSATDVVLTEHSFSGAQPVMTQFSIGDQASPTTNTCPMIIAEAMLYIPYPENPMDSTKRQSILNYFKSVYISGKWTLPLTFPSNAVSTTN